MSEQDARFETTVSMSLEDFQRFNRWVMTSHLLGRKSLITYCAVIAVMAIAGLALGGLRQAGLLAMIFVCFLSLFSLIQIRVILPKTVKKAYDANREQISRAQTYAFFEDHLQVGEGESSIPYDQIFRMDENETDFYLMLSGNQGIQLSKEKCSTELIDFLRKIKQDTDNNKGGSTK